MGHSMPTHPEAPWRQSWICVHLYKRWLHAKNILGGGGGGVSDNFCCHFHMRMCFVILQIWR